MNSQQKLADMHICMCPNLAELEAGKSSTKPKLVTLLRGSNKF